jgi:flagellar basal-body rod modification protein FlgD
MPISTINVGGSTAAQSSNIGIQDFLKILTAQLNSQDPLKPVDNQEFVAQIAQFANLEQSRELNVKVEQLLSSQSSTQSIGLLGKSLDVLVNGVKMSGKVTALALDSGQPLLSITDANDNVQSGISLGQVVNIR